MLFILLIMFGVSRAQEITDLSVPLFADPRRAAELVCRFHMHQRPLHSVKWYYENNEIFRYNPAQKTQIRLFNVTGLMVQAGRCGATECSVQLMPPPAFAQVAYTCEVSSEGPMFQIAKGTKQMTVVAMPEKDPVITDAPEAVSPGQLLTLNCSADYSLPPADITWYIDDVPLKSEAWERRELSAPIAGGLRASWRVMRVKAPAVVTAAVGGGGLRVRCSAVLPLSPPVARTTTAHITLLTSTRHSKYISNEGSSPRATGHLVFIATTLVCALPPISRG